ncbi:hypothetical protein J2Y46_002599 [Microbacterium sp. BE35]|uniref:hypothetical protein n=1 Tax=Microbacterium sp. BE35 TaxID=2817773 RepID=UPI00285FABC1|nr:hypothetical protein [Microbacterium sp. BE35]MDR7189773.1 hypothetical protein [Microbacterium sp. BE35]
MATLLDIASDHARRRDLLSDLTSRKALRLWRTIDPRTLDAGWDRIAPALTALVAGAQVTAARQAVPYTNAVTDAYGEPAGGAKLEPRLFGGATREGRELAPEMFAAVTTTKNLIAGGSGVPAAFRAGATVMSILASTLVSDAGRSADRTLATGKKFTRSVRVVSAGACSRCAILAGVQGYRADFERHPRCRCTSMPIVGDEIPEGFYGSPGDYFESLSAAEQERVFTKSGAEAIRLGADPVKVVNARRGALKSTKRPDGSYSLARLRPKQIGAKADGSPLMVYATPEGTSARSSWARAQNNLTKQGDDRYRRTTTLRLMPEQIMSMSTTPERAVELLKRYGYLY